MSDLTKSAELFAQLEARREFHKATKGQAR